MINPDNQQLLNQFQQYLIQTGLAPKTITNYQADLRVFTRWVEAEYGADFGLAAINPAHIRGYRDFLLKQQGRAASTVNRHLQALRKCCAYLYHSGQSTANAAEEVNLVSTTGQTEKSLSPAQVEALLAVGDGTARATALRDTAILHLLVAAGLRVAEIVALKMDDVAFDFPGLHLRVTDSRSGDVRSIPLTSDVAAALNAWLRVRPGTALSDHIFLNQSGAPLSARSVQRAVNHAAKTAGLAGVTAQTLRRTYAHNLLLKTGDLTLVQTRLGHKNQKVTTQYLALQQQDYQLMV